MLNKPSVEVISLKGGKVCASPCVPQFNGHIVCPCGEDTSIRRKGHALGSLAPMPFQSVQGDDQIVGRVM